MLMMKFLLVLWIVMCLLSVLSVVSCIFLLVVFEVVCGCSLIRFSREDIGLCLLLLLNFGFLLSLVCWIILSSMLLVVIR